MVPAVGTVLRSVRTGRLWRVTGFTGWKGVYLADPEKPHNRREIQLRHLSARYEEVES